MQTTVDGLTRAVYVARFYQAHTARVDQATVQTQIVLGAQFIQDRSRYCTNACLYAVAIIYEFGH